MTGVLWDGAALGPNDADSPKSIRSTQSLSQRHSAMAAASANRQTAPMRPMSRDTHPDAEAVQIELLRRASPARRFELARSLSRTTMWLAWRAIRRAHPDVSDEEVSVRFVALHYGEELAQGLARCLERRRA